MKRMKTKNKTWFSNHSHVWLGIISVLLLVIVFIIRYPVNEIIDYSLISLVLIFGAWLLMPEWILRKFRKKSLQENYDFGWPAKFLKGFGYASFIVMLLAVYSFYALAKMPVFQILSFSLQLLLSVTFFIGNLFARSTHSREGMTLPFVDLFTAGKGAVIDAGCGTGRTSISLLKAVPDLNITAFDRFDAQYIKDGGRALLKQNLELAGIASNINIVQGDLTEMPFNEDNFDAAVSVLVFDHLGENKLSALREMRRVLKPGGRFMLVLMVKGYSSFALGNIFSLAFESRKGWRQLFSKSGFNLIDEGDINF